ncbi:hypothetical protein, partial [Calidifontibacillus erzurumensis]
GVWHRTTVGAGDGARDGTPEGSGTQTHTSDNPNKKRQVMEIVAFHHLPSQLFLHLFGLIKQHLLISGLSII